MWIDDNILRHCHLSEMIRIFVPPRPIVVMARSNPESDCRHDLCQAAQIPVLRRLGGGGTVLLDSGCVVISVGIWVNLDFQHNLFMNLFHQSLQKILKDHWDLTTDLNGLADMVVGGRKFLGASLFRSQMYLLYQGSLLIHGDIELMTRLLPHPSKEPDYRQGRSHRDFLVNLNELRPELYADQAAEVLSKTFPTTLKEYLHDYLGSPSERHVVHLKKRMSSSSYTESSSSP